MLILHNITLVHVSIISTIMRMVLGYIVTSTRWQRARYASTQAADFYRNLSAVTSDDFSKGGMQQKVVGAFMVFVRFICDLASGPTLYDYL